MIDLDRLREAAVDPFTEALLCLECGPDEWLQTHFVVPITGEGR